MKEGKRKFDIRSHGGNLDEVEIQRRIASVCKLGIVELGVLFGETTKLYCQANPDIPIYGIDPIIPDSKNDKLIGSKERILNNTHGCNFTFIQDYSYNVVQGWDKPFDYLFIDASHLYPDVYIDFIDWFPLLAPGGFLAFHDSAKRYGGPHHWDGPSDLVKDIIEGRIRPFRYMPKFYDMVNSLTIFRKCS